jgi:chromosomal replication initiation ATPase DnaA
VSGPSIKKARPSADDVARALDDRGLLEGVRIAAIVNCVTVAEICGRERTGAVARARAAVWRSLRAAGLSFPEIGRLFGRDHTTIVGVLNPRSCRRREAKAS